MTTPASFCTLADVLALVSYDAQARMATDPQVAVPLSVKGDGIATLFDTPFMLATTIVATVAGVTTACTVNPGAGTNGVDQIQFSSPPALNALITAQADLKAINVVIVQQCIDLGASKIRGSLARYDMTSPDATILDILKPMNVFFARWFLRVRRNLNEYDPIIEEYRSNDRWLTGVATGKIALPAKALVATATLPKDPPVITAERGVFEPPFSNYPAGGDPW